LEKFLSQKLVKVGLEEKLTSKNQAIESLPKGLELLLEVRVLQQSLHDADLSIPCLGVQNSLV